MKKLFALILVSLSFSTFANLDGQWTGWGSWTFQGSGVKCYTALSYTETETKLMRHETAFDCQYAVLTMLEQSWDKRGNDILLDGVIVGKVENDHYTITEQYDENVVINADIKVEGNHLDYSEIWYDQGNEVYQIKGRLFRKVN